MFLKILSILYSLMKKEKWGLKRRLAFQNQRNHYMLDFSWKDCLPARKRMLPDDVSILKVIIIEEIWTYGSFRGN